MAWLGRATACFDTYDLPLPARGDLRGLLTGVERPRFGPRRPGSSQAISRTSWDFWSNPSLSCLARWLCPAGPGDRGGRGSARQPLGSHGGGCQGQEDGAGWGGTGHEVLGPHSQVLFLPREGVGQALHGLWPVLGHSRLEGFHELPQHRVDLPQDAPGLVDGVDLGGGEGQYQTGLGATGSTRLMAHGSN